MSFIIETTTIETKAGDYTVTLLSDEYADQPYDEGFVIVTNGAPDRVDLKEGDDPLINRVVQALDASRLYSQGDGGYYTAVSGAALVRWLRLHGRKGVTLVHVADDYTPDDPSTDRSDRVYGVAWAPDDAADPDAYVRAALQQWTAWARGEMFGVSITDPSGEEIDSCYGYYDIAGEREYVLGEATVAVEQHAEHRVAAANTAGAGIVGIV